MRILAVLALIAALGLSSGSLTAGDPNSDPIAVDDAAHTAEDTLVDIDVLLNDGDADGDALSVTAVTDPPNGTAAINLDETVRYTPDLSFTGTDSFMYTISDGAATDTATVRVTIGDLDLAVTKALTVGSSAPSPADALTYQVTVANNGPGDASGVQLTDLLPAGLTISGTPVASAGAYTVATGVWDIGALANGASATLDLTGTVDAGTEGDTITNTAALSAVAETDVDPSNDSASVAVVVGGGVDIAVTKALTVGSSTPAATDPLTFQVTATNNGPGEATGVEVTDLLPAGLTISGTPVASAGAYTVATGVWDIGALANGASATLDLTATVDAGTEGDTITNAAAVTAVTETDTEPSNDSASVAVVVGGGVDIAVTKALTVGTSAPNPTDGLTYQVTVTNNGPLTATGVLVTDLLPAGLTPTGVPVADAGTSYNATTGVWAIGTLAPLASVTLDLSGTVDAGTEGDTITNTATVTNVDETDVDPSNDSASVAVVVGGGVDIAVTKTLTDGSDEPDPADELTFRVTATNNGPLDANGVVVTDLLPAGFTVSGTPVASAGTSYDSTTGVWTIGTLADGADATLDITATVDAGTEGDTITNTAALSAVDETDVDDGNDSASVDVTVKGEPDGEDRAGKADKDGKVTICHIPPGNPDNGRTITISENAWPAHERHGDTLDAC